MEIALDRIEWHNRRGNRVNLTFRPDGTIGASPWLPSFRPGAVITRGFRRSLKDLVVWASGKSNFYISKILNAYWNATSYSFPASSFHALWTSTLNAASTGATAGECLYTAYARVTVSASTGNFPASVGGAAVTNGVAITFPANGGSLQTATFYAVLDSATLGAGNIIYWGSISSTAINPSDVPTVQVGALSSSEL
jgi:hypothetical protein